ncbi:hypothetical protein G9A89_021756 [Geosiphon pyriformis]|nr:hypothetical protein G9A89_021756 [Geosiphon pyriformis]
MAQLCAACRSGSVYVDNLSGEIAEFCSNKCRRAAVDKGMVEPCINCNLMPRALIGGQRINYCGKTCKNEAEALNPKGKAPVRNGQTGFRHSPHKGSYMIVSGQGGKMPGVFVASGSGSNRQGNTLNICQYCQAKPCFLNSPYCSRTCKDNARQVSRPPPIATLATLSSKPSPPQQPPTPNGPTKSPLIDPPNITITSPKTTAPPRQQISPPTTPPGGTLLPHTPSAPPISVPASPSQTIVAPQLPIHPQQSLPNIQIVLGHNYNPQPGQSPVHATLQHLPIVPVGPVGPSLNIPPRITSFAEPNQAQISNNVAQFLEDELPPPYTRHASGPSFGVIQPFIEGDRKITRDDRYNDENPYDFRTNWSEKPYSTRDDNWVEQEEHNYLSDGNPISENYPAFISYVAIEFINTDCKNILFSEAITDYPKFLFGLAELAYSMTTLDLQLIKQTKESLSSIFSFTIHKTLIM